VENYPQIIKSKRADRKVFQLCGLPYLVWNRSIIGTVPVYIYDIDVPLVPFDIVQHHTTRRFSHYQSHSSAIKSLSRRF